MIVAIDGPTSSGKNSVGFLLAQKLNFQYIDTGMIYRVGTYLVLKNSISLNSVEQITDIFRNLKLEIRNSKDGLVILNKGEDLTGILHSPEVTKNVPIVAAIKEVREVTKLIQRRLGEGQNMVMTGRDIGSEIFPDAKYKFFLTAKVEIRARRRFEQLAKADSAVRYEQVLQDMIDRDKADSEREISPLRVPENGVIIDNSDLSVEETVEEMLKHINA